MDRGRRLARWAYVQFGAAYFRIVAVGGSAAIVFLAIWPLTTVVVVVPVAASTPVVQRVRRHPAERTETQDAAPPAGAAS